MGAGCGRSRGFWWLNLNDPYEASLFACEADAGAGAGGEAGAFARLAASRGVVRVGSLDRERAEGEGAM